MSSHNDGREGGPRSNLNFAANRFHVPVRLPWYLHAMEAVLGSIKGATERRNLHTSVPTKCPDHEHYSNFL